MVAAAALALAGPLGAALAVAATPLPEELREPAAAGSVVVEDRDGAPSARCVRAMGRALDGCRCASSSRSRCARVLAAEDARFYDHPGVDAWALVAGRRDDCGTGASSPGDRR